MPTQPHHSVKPSPMRNLSEYAVADTPGTAGPEYAGAGDYLQARFAPISPLAPGGGAHSHTQPHGGDQNQGGSVPEKEGGIPPALERGVRGGSGPMNDTEQQGTRYVNPGEVPQGTKQNENVDAAEGQMEMYPEGKVADAVERTQRHRARRGSVSVSAARAGSPPGGLLHGRGRGEVTLEAGEADLERKKQQQAAARKQVMDARKRGEDVDGRGATGPSGRQPRAEID